MQIPIFIKPLAIMKNVLSWFNGILAAWTTKFFVREESESIFTYQHMIGDSSGSSSAKQVRMAKVFELVYWGLYTLRDVHNANIISI